MLNSILRSIFGTRNDRVIKSYRPIVEKINSLESEISKLSDEDLKSKTLEFKSRIEKAESLDSLLPEAFAVVREAGKRVLGLRHYDVQLIGGIALHQGMISEMRTGEGKTLVATLPAYLNALSGKGVHVVTVNDYLARRDAEWMGRIHEFLGLSVGVVYSQMPDLEKKLAYQADITYAQNNEIGFDYLRDNGVFSIENKVQRGLNFAIIDEVDSILIDEARTPLIISGPAEDSSELYMKIDQIIPSLRIEEDYKIDLKTKQITLTEVGIANAEKLLGIENLYDPTNIELLHHVNQGLKAHNIFTKDIDYLVQGGKIVIVDEFTGRQMPGRRWSDGLHQAIEAKEKVNIQRESQTIATITFQNLFRLYNKLSGMAGTAVTEASEFKEIYNLDVLVIPTNQPMIRMDQNDVLYVSLKDKVNAVVEEIIEVHKAGQPVLVGTVSIEQSELYSRELEKRRIAHQVLNAKHHSKEAEIVAQAGRLAAVTIATNMAGRGTDILLGGNPEVLASKEYSDTTTPEYEAALKKYQELCEAEKLKVQSAGGLYILGTERHESRRIDNQLRGRAGRQGDPGRSRFFLSLEDDLMRRFIPPMVIALAQRNAEGDNAIDSRALTNAVEKAQSKVEHIHFDQRKQVTKYDDVMNKQRLVVYSLRNQILEGKALNDELNSMLQELAEDLVLEVCDPQVKPIHWNLQQLKDKYKLITHRELELNDSEISEAFLYDIVVNQILEDYESNKVIQSAQLDDLKSKYDESLTITTAGENQFDFKFDSIERESILKNLDRCWLQHLQAMDDLKEGIFLRSYAQQNPLHEYQKEGFTLFQAFFARMREYVLREMFAFNTEEFSNYLQQHQQEMLRRARAMEQMQQAHQQFVEDDDFKSALNEKKKLEDQKKLRRKFK